MPLSPSARWKLWIAVALSVIPFAGRPALALDVTRAISQYGHKRWTLQDGDLSGAPKAFAQTTDGYLWIGTEAGLLRFDGVRFERLTSPDGAKLPSARIYALHAARDGSLWIGTRLGLARWRNGRLNLYPEIASAVEDFVEDSEGRIWFARTFIADQQGPLCEVLSDRAMCHGAADGVPIAYARALSLDSSDHLWMVSDDTVLRWRRGASQSYFPATIREPGLLDGYSDITLTSDGAVWVGGWRPSLGAGLMRLADGQLNSFVLPGFDAGKLSVNALYVDRQNALWIGTEDAGLYRLYQGTVSHYRLQDGLSGNSVQDVFEDREGTLWVATSQGIDSFRDLPVTILSSREGLSADLVSSVLATRDGTIRLGMAHSLEVVSAGKLSSLHARNGFPGEEVTAQFEDRAGNVWMGVDDELYVIEAGRFEPIKRADGSPTGYIMGITQDVSGDIWFTTFVPPSSGLLARIRNRKIVEEIPRSKIEFSAGGEIVADPRDGIWFSLKNGDLAHLRQAGELRTIRFNRKPGAGRITGIVVNADGSIVGSSALGIIGWQDDRAHTLTMEQGLPCDELYTLVNDREGGLWLYGSCGFIYIAKGEVQARWRDPARPLEFRVFDTVDGAQPGFAEFIPRSSLGADGRLWFANASVAQVIDPTHLAMNVLPPPVHIESLTADRRIFPARSGLKLWPRVRDLQLDYTALSLAVPRENRFRYRLEGHDRDWQDAGTRRQAFYNDLPPGNYRFRVIASNNDGVWNETGALLDFEIPPAYYQTTWFRLLCLATLVALIWIAVVLRVRTLTARMRSRLEERMSERERIARELHDTLLQGFHGLVLRLQVVMGMIPAAEPARHVMECTLDRADELLKESRDRISDLRGSTSASLPEELAALAEQTQKSESIRISVMFEGSVRPLSPLIHEEIYSVGREALTNAVRHSKGTRIEVEIDYSDLAVRLCVRDDGEGIPPDVLRAGGRTGHWGLSGMRERAEKMGGQLKVWNRSGVGAEVELRVPAAVAYTRASTERAWWRGVLRRLSSNVFLGNSRTGR